MACRKKGLSYKYLALICIYLLISYCSLLFVVFGDTTKPTKEIALWEPVQSVSCPDIQVPLKNNWRYQDGFRRHHWKIDIDGDNRPDVVEAEDSNGSTGGLTSVTLTLTSTKERIGVDYYYTYEFFVSETTIPDKLTKPKYH